MDTNTSTVEESNNSHNDGYMDDPDNHDNEPGESINGDTETDSGYRDDTDSVENKSDVGDFETFTNPIKEDSDEAKDADKTLATVDTNTKDKEAKVRRN